MREETQEIGSLKIKIAEYEKLKMDLDDANKALSDLKITESAATTDATQTNTPMANDTRAGLELKLSEKDKVIAFLHEELGRYRIGGAPKIEPSDFSSLNESLARFSAEIALAKSELEEAQTKMNMM